MICLRKIVQFWIVMVGTGALLSSPASAGIVPTPAEVGETDVSVTSKTEGAKILVRLGKSGGEGVRVLDRRGNVLATLHEGEMKEGTSYTFDWKAGKEIPSGDYTVEILQKGSPFRKNFPYTKSHPLKKKRNIWDRSGR